jgi:hypothetical protein
MKYIANKLLTTLTCLIGISNTFAKPNPPPPNFKKPPPPPGLPIDENLYILLLIAVLFGIYIIYRHNLKTKTPI